MKSVETKIEEGIARLLLNLGTQADSEKPPVVMPEYDEQEEDKMRASMNMKHRPFQNRMALHVTFLNKEMLEA